LNRAELKAARIRRGITSKDMAKKLGLTAQQYCYKENGSRRIFLGDAQNIAKILQLTPAEILLIFFDININSNNK